MSGPTLSDKVYLGDAVYVSHDGFGILLTTEDGIKATNKIYLEPEVWHALQSYVKSIALPADLNNER